MSRIPRHPQSTSPNRSAASVAQSMPAAPATAGPIHDLITRRAYLNWKARGCRYDTAVQDWLEAEAEILKELHHGR